MYMFPFNHIQTDRMQIEYSKYLEGLDETRTLDWSTSVE